LPFELTLGKEVRKPMDLTTPMSKKIIPKKLWRWSKGVKNYTPKPKKLLEA
jgi:hypothetical protein